MHTIATTASVPCLVRLAGGMQGPPKIVPRESLAAARYAAIVTVTSIERTLILIKPDGVARNLTGEVLRRVEAKGYRIAALQMRHADAELLAQHYAEHAGKPFYQPLVDFMLSGPIVAAVAEGDRVIEGFRALAGATDPTAATPGTIRGDLGRDWGESVQKNVVHGSDSPESAEREIGLWFPRM
jgi:nucleoside-diphosphate kinase